MTRDPAATIRFLGTDRGYIDGAENEVLSALEAVSDRSDGSDELSRRSTDWATTYHFSPRRSNILRPFEITAEYRVLEIGAGTGVITRHLGERGARVVALEGDPLRARSIACRCEDLSNVEVVSGALGDFDDPEGFDIAVVVGVLEYAGAASEDDHHQIAFLRQVADHLRPDGTLILAIENQIGLKYLLGYSEDHLSEPWAGIEGYPGRPAVCTMSRAKLRSALTAGGFGHQRWFFPYPDYKLPKTIIAERAFELESAVDLVEQLAGRPVQDLANPPSRFCDDRASHRAFLEAGLGPEVANSFLVVATKEQIETSNLIDDSVVAWHFSADRLRPWRRTQTIRRLGDNLRVEAHRTHPAAPSAFDSWLTHEPGKDDPLHLGRTLEQTALDFARDDDIDGLRGVIERWRTILDEKEIEPQPIGEESLPFEGRMGHPSLPPEYLDSSLSNFIDTGETVVFIDREWRVGQAIDSALTRFRALWYLALEIVVSGIAHPFGADTTVDELADHLGSFAGLDPDHRLREDFFTAESRLQETVTGAPAGTIALDLHKLGSSSRTGRLLVNTLPVAQLRRDLVRAEALVKDMEAETTAARDYLRDLESKIAEGESQTGALENEYRRMEALTKATQSEYRKLESWAQGLQGRVDQFETQHQMYLDRGEKLELESRKLKDRIHELEEQNAGVTGELGQVRNWQQRVSELGLVRLALAIHRRLGRGEADY